MKGHLQLAFSGPNDSEVVKGLVVAEVPGQPPPSETNIDDREKPVVGDWIARAFSAMRLDATAYWRDQPDPGFMSFGRARRVPHPVKVTRKNRTFTYEYILPLLRELPYELCSADAPWDAEWTALPDYTTYGFADSHFGHGWMCAFKGKGHDRLLSRRWLQAGDWYLHREQDIDLSVILFHDPDADPVTAFHQALPNHRRMGISHEGGFIQSGSWPHKLDKGLYDAGTRTLRVVVLGRDVPETEMTDAAMHRHYHRNDAEQPVDNVAYVFVDPNEAPRHLHGLWLRELECWVIEDGVERRLDLDYSPPPPERSEWVERLRARYGDRGRGLPIVLPG